MSNIVFTPKWNSAINQVESYEPITGGANGNANLASKQLAENVFYLKNEITTISLEVNDTNKKLNTEIAAVKSYADTKKTEAINESKTYTDTQDATNLTAAKSYTDTQDATNLTSAKSYADTKKTEAIASANTYTDQKQSISTYTPTFSSLTGITSVTGSNITYIKTDKQITVFGTLMFNIPAAGNISCKMSLPVTSNFVGTNQAGGTILSVDSIYGYVTSGTDKLLSITANSTLIGTAIVAGFNFTYIIV